MPLEPATRLAAHTDPATLSVVFAMKNAMADEIVRVTISPDAIQKLGGGPDPIEVFETNRGALERIASAKFDRMGGSAEVTVREEDLV